MRDADGSLQHELPSGTSSAYKEMSAHWVYDAMEEDAEPETDRVVWMPSQPKDPALNQLMNDAYFPQKTSVNVRTNGWSPSPSALTSGTSSSSTSPAERTGRIRKTLKRRSPSAANGGQTTSTSTSPGVNNLEENIHKLVALLPLVSKQADENAKREQEALRERQRKQRRTARSLRDSSVMTKKHRTSTEVRGKRRDADLTRGEEEMSISERLEGEKQQNEKARLREDNAATPDEVSMPPPSFVPIRKALPKPERPQLFPMNEHILKGRSSCKTEMTEALSFASASIATSACQLPSAQGENATYAQLPSAAGDHVVYAGSKDALASSPSPSASGPAISNVSYHTSSPTPTRGPPTNSNRHRTSHERTATPPHPTSDRAACPPKLNGPPALGMRRHVNGLTPSLSQSLTKDRPLPIKRGQFKVPFAKNGAEQHDHSPGSTQQKYLNASTPSCSGLGSSLSGHRQGSDTSSQSPDSHSVRNNAPPASSSTTRYSRDTEAARGGDAADDRSSPPPADADSSIDFDMDFDPEELEKVCSAFD